MTMNIPLLACLIGTIIVSSVATGMVRSASSDLPPETRDRIAQAEFKLSSVWRYMEWLGIGLILLAMFLPQMMLFTAASQRIITIAVGLMLFGSANTCGAWFSFSVNKREAPESKAASAALRGALFVTLAEMALIGVVIWIVLTRLDMSAASKPNVQNGAVILDEKVDSANWIDESLALKELSGLDREYVQGLVESGALRTKMVAGKKMYRLSDVQDLKTKPKDSFQ